MAFCNYSQELVDSSYTTVDNVFITHYLPDAPSKYVDIYLFGLYLCSKQNGDNDIDVMARALNLDKDDILTAFTYWEELGLVSILQKTPFEVVYRRVRQDDALLKKINPQKYRQFNKDIQNVLCGRIVSPNEFNEYYVFLETTFFEPKALVAVAKYCVEKKGEDINYPYILKVARNLSDSGVKTLEAVEEKLATSVKYTDDINLLFKALGIRRGVDFEDRRLFEKWTAGMGFSADTVYYVAKLNKKASMEKLDKKLEKYFKMGLFDEKAIKDYEKNREKMYELTASVNRILGVYYQSLDFIIEDYVTPWLQKGFDEDALQLIAKYCFKQNVRSIEGMNDVVGKFYKKGLVTSSAISDFTLQAVSRDAEIKEVLTAAGVERSVSSYDRGNFKTWTEVWGFGKEILLYVASLSVGANNPAAYMNKILSELKSKNIFDVEQAKQLSLLPKKQQKATVDYRTREYSKEEMDALFDNLDEVEI